MDSPKASSDGRLRAQLRSWILGVFLALVFAWTVGYFSLDYLLLFEWNPVLGIRTFKPGVTYKHRSEGWGTSHIGRYGVIGIPDIAAIRHPKIAIWGDSHVEGFQVDDSERMPQVLTRLLKAEGFDIVAFGIGRSGESIADYYFKMPLYEKLCSPVIAHFIILCDLSDVLPDRPEAERARFVSHPTFRFVEEIDKSEYQGVKRILASTGLNFVWWIGKSLPRMKTLRFGIDRVKDQEKPDDKSISVSDAVAKRAWSFLLPELKRQTGLPIVFVYCPFVPLIKGGTIEYSDDRSESVETFQNQCRKYGIGFINMEKGFQNYTRREGQFPRGFSNSKPSQGHFNSAGHKLIAEAILHYIQDQRVRNAIHSD